MGLDNPLHIAVLALIVVLVFGAKRVPDIGRSLGKGLREFREVKDSITAEPAKPVPAALTEPEAARAPAAAPAPDAAPAARAPDAAPAAPAPAAARASAPAAPSSVAGPPSVSADPDEKL